MSESHSQRPSLVESLGSRYESKPILRSLIQLIPLNIGSAIDTALITKVNNLREHRLRVFFDELGNGDIPLTVGVVNDSDFLHAYFSTVKAALNARRDEKIRLFGRLLRNFSGRKAPIDFDEYEETLSILDELTIRELQALLLLKEFESTHPKQEDQRSLKHVQGLWPSFLQALEAQVGIVQDLIPGFLERLNRTGLYQTFVGGFFDYGGDRGHTTPYFDKFISDLSIRSLSDIR